MTADEQQTATTTGLLLARGVFPNAEELLRSILEAAPAFIASTTPDGKLLFINRLAEGFSPADVQESTVFEFTDPASHEAIRSCFTRVLRTRQNDEFEAVGQGPNRTIRRYHTQVAPIVRNGEVVALTLFATDITERKVVEAALRESEERLRLTVAGTGMGLWSWEPEPDVITWDDRLCSIAGLSADQAPRTIGDYTALVHPEDRPLLAGRVARARRDGETTVSEYRILRPDGEVRWVQVLGHSVRDASGRVLKVVGGTLDVTERRAVEERLRQSQKLEAIGQLTAGIAHNFNNLLMAILPNLELLSRQPQGELGPLLDDAQRATERAAELVRQLLLFAGRRGPRPSTAEDVGSIVERTLAICRGTFDRRIVIEVRELGERPLVAVDAGQIEQALLNVCLNARDALADVPEPRLRVTIEALAPEAPAIAAYPGAASRPHVCILVEDNGQGMDETTRRRVFEPFFTTKPVGRGTGLGLATAYGIVRAHRGWMAVASTPGQGTAVSIYLPAADEAAVSTPARVPEEVRGGTERVLLVDDEALVRQVVARLLADAGYEVVVASGAREAMERYAGDPKGFALVLLDVTMPDGSGREVCRRIQELRPAQRVVYFSGNVLEDAPEAAAVVLKPIGADDLLRQVRRVLDGT